MYLLVFYQGEQEIKIGLFDSIEQGREFLRKVPGYDIKLEDGFEYETIDSSSLNDYEEIEFQNHIIPVTRFSFDDDTPIDIEWYEIADLSKKGSGIISGFTKVDAYVIDNQEVKEYIVKREEKYSHVKKLLEKNGYEVDRSFAGSQDGEAIVYKDKKSDDWYFLTHMDPDFVLRDIDDEEILKDLVEE